MDNNVWHHYVITIKSGEQYLYIDGQQKFPGQLFSGWNSANQQGCYVGRSYYTGSNYPFFNGKLDNFRIYNRAITPTEVSTIFNANQ
ncbi:MAG: LamG domain-containing protein [Saprospirales bacterium]|nr:LamG domain-containing protein [Saprospirales bacterium]